MAKTSGPETGIESMLAAGKKRRETTTKLPEGYTAGGVPGGKGGGNHIGRSSHAMLRELGGKSPANVGRLK